VNLGFWARRSSTIVRGTTNEAPFTMRNQASLISKNGARRGLASWAIPILTAKRVWAISRKHIDTRITVAFVTLRDRASRRSLCRLNVGLGDLISVLSPMIGAERKSSSGLNLIPYSFWHG
jgi:hypothetical protein